MITNAAFYGWLKAEGFLRAVVFSRVELRAPDVSKLKRTVLRHSISNGVHPVMPWQFDFEQFEDGESFPLCPRLKEFLCIPESLFVFPTVLSE
jgi:hypothetical protein